MKKIPDDKKRTVSARFPKSLIKQLKDLSYKENRSVSSMLQTLVESAVRKSKTDA